MQTVILTIVFLASPAGAQQSSSVEMRDVSTCESVAETWRRWPGGLLKVMSATCSAGNATAAASDGAKSANVARN